jgi:hypothetical protein
MSSSPSNSQAGVQVSRRVVSSSSELAPGRFDACGIWGSDAASLASGASISLSKTAGMRRHMPMTVRERIGAGKRTALLAVKAVGAGALRHTSDHLGRPEGTPVYSRVTPAGGEH